MNKKDIPTIKSIQEIKDNTRARMVAAMRERVVGTIRVDAKAGKDHTFIPIKSIDCRIMDGFISLLVELFESGYGIKLSSFNAVTNRKEVLLKKDDIEALDHKQGLQTFELYLRGVSESILGNNIIIEWE